MTALVLLGWFALALGMGWRHRPSPPRLRALAPAPPAARSALGPQLAAALTRLGCASLRRLGRPGGPEAGRRLGTALAVGAVAVALLPVAAVPAALVAWALPAVGARRRHRRRLAAIVADLPDVVDLLVLAVGAGLTVRLAVAAVARRSPGPLGAELARAGQEADLGRRLADALDDVPIRAGEAARPLVAALIASERYGAPLAASLERLASEVRADRRRRAEEAARKVPVKLLFPLVSCTLPAFGLLTVAPLIASAVRSLRL
ncbi:MAG TPA: type II secretion system F family protein [Acidimicrobiales bacterium]|nr:type II secretion system F family protein [Acidimicrobiales bacterium]